MNAFLDRLYNGEMVGPVILVTGLLGCGAAWLTGRAIALTWRQPFHVVIAMLLLGAAARFIHFALFQGNLLSFTSYLCDVCIFLIVGLIAWRATRTAQMVRQYPWLYARSGPLSWRSLDAKSSRKTDADSASLTAETEKERS